MTRTPVLATASVGIAVALAIATRGDAAGPPSTLDVVLKLPEARIAQVDAPPLRTSEEGPTSPGDVVVLHAPLRTPAGARTGQVDATFTATDKGDREQLVATFTVGGSQIAVQGIDAAAAVDRLPVVGGTGRFAGARGTLVATEKGPERRFHFKLRR